MFKPVQMLSMKSSTFQDSLRGDTKQDELFSGESQFFSTGRSLQSKFASFTDIQHSQNAGEVNSSNCAGRKYRRRQHGVAKRNAAQRGDDQPGALILVLQANRESLVGQVAWVSSDPDFLMPDELRGRRIPDVRQAGFQIVVWETSLPM